MWGVIPKNQEKHTNYNQNSTEVSNKERGNWKSKNKTDVNTGKSEYLHSMIRLITKNALKQPFFHKTRNLQNLTFVFNSLNYLEQQNLQILGFWWRLWFCRAETDPDPCWQSSWDDWSLALVLPSTWAMSRGWG